MMPNDITGLERVKALYTLSVKLSDFNVWRHTWRKNWVNCAVLTGNSAGQRTILSSRLSHRELRSSLRESYSILSLPADTTMASSQGTQKNWKNWQTWRETCAVPENFQFRFSCSFFTQLNCAVRVPLDCKMVRITLTGNNNINLKLNNFALVKCSQRNVKMLLALRGKPT
jgi:hypothetical protein